MLNHTPNYWVPKATTLPTKLGGTGSKNDAQQNQVNL